MITIASMRVENFLSFGKADFSFDRAGLVLVEGDNRDDPSASSNGSGKSALIDALVWCLFGTTLRGYEKDEVVHRKAKVGAGCLVEVTIGGHNQSWTISRARRHPKLKNSLTVTSDNLGDDMSGASATETQEMIDKLLGCTRSAFLSSVVFGQDRAYRFGSLTDGEQKKILDEVLGVERFALACGVARQQASGAQAKLGAARIALEMAEAAEHEADADVASLREKDAGFAKDRLQRLAAERDGLAKAADWIAKNKKTATNIEAFKIVVDEHLGHLAAREKKVEKGIEICTTVRVTKAERKAKLEEVEADLRKRQKLPLKCPACRQPVTRKVGTEAVASLSEQVTKLKADLCSAIRAEARADSALSEDKLVLKELREEMATAQKELNEAVGAEANAKAWRQRAKDHENRLALIERETSPYAELAEKAEARRLRHRKDAEARAVEARLAGRELELAKFWVEAFGARGLRSLLIDSSLPLLNEEAARVSRAVTGGTISVEFSATSEQKSGKVVDRFEVRVDNRHGAGDYRGNSAGERAKVDLCVGLAIQRLVASRSTASFNLCFFDEAFDHLDSAAHERVIEVLSEIDKESVFVVSHNEDLRAFFPNVLTIKKEGGFSSVEQ